MILFELLGGTGGFFACFFLLGACFEILFHICNLHFSLPPLPNSYRASPVLGFGWEASLPVSSQPPTWTSLNTPSILLYNRLLDKYNFVGGVVMQCDVYSVLKKFEGLIPIDEPTQLDQQGSDLATWGWEKALRIEFEKRVVGLEGFVINTNSHDTDLEFLSNLADYLHSKIAIPTA